MKRILPLLLTMVVFLAACAPEATPTMSPADVQATAVAAASLMVAATQQAIPTSTPTFATEPSRPTPPPTFTPTPDLTQPILPTAILSLTYISPDNCLHPLNIAETGPKKRVRIENQSGGTNVNLSLNLYQPNAAGQCGVLSWADKPANWIEIIELPSGSWFAYAWITCKEGSSESEGTFALGNSKSDDILRLIIKKDTIILEGP